MKQIILSIDFGGTSTDIVKLHNNVIVGMTSCASEAVISEPILEQLVKTHLNPSEKLDQIIVTGGKSHSLPDSMDSAPITHIDEIRAIGRGGLFLSDLDQALVVSMGTGTAMIKVSPDAVSHINGTGLGGGTILGLGQALLDITDFDQIENLAAKGNAGSVDLTIGDIIGDRFSILPEDATASNFGKLSQANSAPATDMARALFGLVVQNIALLAITTSRAHTLSPIIITGRPVNSHLVQQLFIEVGTLYDSEFIFPEHARYSVAIGATIACNIPVRLS